jgi:hypothetical protein
MWRVDASPEPSKNSASNYNSSGSNKKVDQINTTRHWNFFGEPRDTVGQNWQNLQLFLRLIFFGFLLSFYAESGQAFMIT